MDFPTSEHPPIFFLEPESQLDVMSALQKLKERYTVVINLEKLDSSLAKQASDMMAGCTCAIEGKSTWLGKDTYMYTPNNVDVSLER